MKKYLSLLIAAAMLSAAAIPVFADYTAPEEESSYDIVQLNNTYDDGTTTNDIDGSAAKQLTAEERVVELADDSIWVNEFYMSFDFRFDSDSGYIGIDKRKSSGVMEKQGPLFSYDGTNLRTQTGGSSYQTITSVSKDTWYTAEFEGKMVVNGANVKMTVYDASHAVVGTVDSLHLRQFYGGSQNGRPNTIRANGVSLDNIKIISENPDTIAVTANEDIVKAGQTDVLDYSMTRLDVPVTKYDVTWSVYDEANETPVSEDVAYVSSEGVLIVSIAAESQTVTVRASKTFGEKELVGTKQIAIEAVNTDSEKFDAIAISGADSLKAGTSETYTFTASKAGEDVTASITDADVVWSIYNCDDLNPNNNKNIKIENGVLTVADGVLSQSIYVRATSPSGNVYSSKKVDIAFSDSQIENVVMSNACETASETADRVESVDGSTAYLFTQGTEMKFGNQEGYTLTDMDIKFTTNGAGFVLKRNDSGKTNTHILFNNDNLATHGGTIMTGADTETWYHIEIVYVAEDASCNIYKYDTDGNLGEPVACLDLNRRNAAAYGLLRVEAGTCIDNIKVSKPAANQISVTAPGQFIFAGETAQFTATAMRNGLPLKNYAGLTWSVYGEDGSVPEGVSIDGTGLVTVDGNADAQKLTVVAAGTGGIIAETEITVQVSEIFTVTNLGINEENTKLVKLYVDKNFYYDDDASFITTIKDADGVLKAVNVVKTFGSRLSLGANELTIDMNLPADFNAETDVIETMVWTTF